MICGRDIHFTWGTVLCAMEKGHQGNCMPSLPTSATQPGLSEGQVRKVLMADMGRRKTHTMEQRISSVTADLNAQLAASQASPQPDLLKGTGCADCGKPATHLMEDSPLCCACYEAAASPQPPEIKVTTGALPGVGPQPHEYAAIPQEPLRELEWRLNPKEIREHMIGHLMDGEGEESGMNDQMFEDDISALIKFWSSLAPAPQVERAATPQEPPPKP